MNEKPEPRNLAKDDIDRLFAVLSQSEPSPDKDILAILASLRNEYGRLNSSEKNTSDPNVRFTTLLTTGNSPRFETSPKKLALVATLVLTLCAVVLLILTALHSTLPNTAPTPAPVAIATMPFATPILQNQANNYLVTVTPLTPDHGTLPSLKLTLTPSNNSNLNNPFGFLTYPGSTTVKVLDTISMGAFATKDNWQTVGNYYKQLFKSQNYVVITDTISFCGDNDCENLYFGDSSNLFSVEIYGPDAWQKVGTNIPLPEDKNESIDLKEPPLSGQTLIAYSYRVGPLPANIMPPPTPTITPVQTQAETNSTHPLVTVQPPLVTVLPTEVSNELIVMPFDMQLPDIKVYQPNRQAKISKEYAMKVVYNISGKQVWASPNGNRVNDLGQPVTLSDTFGLVTEGSLVNGRSWAGIVNLPISTCDSNGNCKDTGKKLDHLENRPMWILDYGNLSIPSFGVMCSNTCTPTPTNNHLVYFVDEDSGGVMMIKQYHQ